VKQLVTHSRQATFFSPARPQPIRDAILAYLTEPRLAVDIARHIKRPVPKKDIDVRDLITSVTGGDLYVRTQASAASTGSASITVLISP